MKKVIAQKQFAQEQLMEGVNLLADIVASTLSPKGRNVGYIDEYGSPRVVHDGVSVAKQVVLDNEFQNFGATLVRQAALKSNDVAGDGTTTATIIAREMIREGFKAVAEGANPMDIKRGIEQATPLLVEQLEKERKVVGEKDIEFVSIVSAQDEKIGKIIAEVVSKVGQDGLVTVEDGATGEIAWEIKEGFELNRGWASPFFVTNIDTEEAVMENAHILLVDHRVQTQNQLVPLLEEFIKDKQNLCIIAEKIEGDALKFLVHNHLKGHMRVICVKAPERGDRKKSILHDIATVTGARVISEDAGQTVAGAQLQDLGFAQKIVASSTRTTIIGGAGDESDKQAHIETLRKLIKEEKDEYQKEFLQERLARITGGVGVIYVGGQTDVEMQDRKERVIDAVHATQAAQEEGILPGGAGVLLRAGTIIGKRALDEKLEPDVARGYAILANACAMPFVQLMENAGLSLEGRKEVINKPGFGVDVMDGQTKNMAEAGIIDAFKVVKLAVVNASSVAGMIITTYGLIIPKDKSV